MKILEYIRAAKSEGRKLLAVLIDPDKVSDPLQIIEHLKRFPPDLIFVGGSVVNPEDFEFVISCIYNSNICPTVIFPGNYNQISDHSDAILLLSLISGRNAEYLIEQQVKSADRLENYPGDIIPTSYILIDGQKKTSVQDVSQTKPISQDNSNLIRQTLLAGKFLGHQLHYLEAGSGASIPISTKIIQEIKSLTPHPIIVGGGIRQVDTARQLWNAGADIIVVGNAIESNPNFLADLNNIERLSKG